MSARSSATAPSPNRWSIRPPRARWIPSPGFSPPNWDRKDPFGQAVSVLEARTFSPLARRPADTSLCGYFEQLSLPVAKPEAGKEFWEPLGFVATEEVDDPYVHLPLTSDRLNIAFHRPRTLDRPMLVFSDLDMPGRLARLRELDLRFSDELPRGLDAHANALLEAPEGTPLLLLKTDD